MIKKKSRAMMILTIGQVASYQLVNRRSKALINKPYLILTLALCVAISLGAGKAYTQGSDRLEVSPAVITVPPQVSRILTSYDTKDTLYTMAGKSGVWQVLVDHDFEDGQMPGGWEVVDNNSFNGFHCWGIDSIIPYQGNYCMWCAAGCTEGEPSDHWGGKYPAGMWSWAFYGPFSMADALDGQFTFAVKTCVNLSEPADDELFFFGTSIDGNYFNGSVARVCKDWHVFTHKFTDRAGEPQVWYGLLFGSTNTTDGSCGTNRCGTFIDNMQLLRKIPATATPTPSPSPTPTVTPTATNTVPPPQAPIMYTMPPYTSGYSRTARWYDPPGSSAYMYWAEYDLSPGFPAPLNSGWIFTRYHTFTNLHDGSTYYYRVRAKNIQDVMSPWSNTASSTQDASPPETWVWDTLDPVYYTMDIYLPYSAYDDTSGVDHVTLWYKKDYSPWQQYNGHFTGSPIFFHSEGSGQYQFYTIGVDIVGNQESAPSSPDASTVINADTPTTSPTLTPSPTISATPTGTPTVTNTPTITPTPSPTPDVPDTPEMYPEPPFTRGYNNTVSWSDESESGAYAYYAECYTMDKGVVQASGWIPETMYEFEGLESGVRYYYHVKAKRNELYDTNWSAPTWSTQDASQPSVTIEIPQPGTFLPGGENLISGYADDNISSISKVELRFDANETWVEATGQESWSYTWMPPSDGPYTIVARSTDQVGNQSDPSAPVNVVVDSTAPAVQIGGYGTTSLSSQAGGALNMLAFVPHPDIVSVEIYFDGVGTGILLRDDGKGGDLTADDGIYTFATPLYPPLSPLQALLEVVATDYAGNQGWFPKLMVKQ